MAERDAKIMRTALLILITGILIMIIVTSPTMYTPAAIGPMQYERPGDQFYHEHV